MVEAIPAISGAFIFRNVFKSHNKIIDNAGVVAIIRSYSGYQERLPLLSYLHFDGLAHWVFISKERFSITLAYHYIVQFIECGCSASFHNWKREHAEKISIGIFQAGRKFFVFIPCNRT